MHLYIKNMVCDRCIFAVRQQLEQLGLPYKNIKLGEVELVSTPDAQQLMSLKTGLQSLGFEWLDDKKTALVEKVKNVIIDLIHHSDEFELPTKLSVLLEEKIGINYQAITSLFSSIQGITLEKYLILQRIEKVKELMLYDELNVSEIAWKLGYSSVQHLSQQFKTVTGFTPTQFKQLKVNTRTPLDKI